MYLFFVCIRIWDNMNGPGEICGRQLYGTTRMDHVKFVEDSL